MEQARDDKCANQERRPNDPGRRKRQGVAQLIQFLLKALQYVLPHDTKYRSETPNESGGFTLTALECVPVWTGERSTGNDCHNPDPIQGDFVRVGSLLNNLKSGFNENFPAASVHLV